MTQSKIEQTDIAKLTWEVIPPVQYIGHVKGKLQYQLEDRFCLFLLCRMYWRLTKPVLNERSGCPPGVLKKGVLLYEIVKYTVLYPSRVFQTGKNII